VLASVPIKSDVGDPNGVWTTVSSYLFYYYRMRTYRSCSSRCKHLDPLCILVLGAAPWPAGAIRVLIVGSGMKLSQFAICFQVEGGSRRPPSMPGPGRCRQIPRPRSTARKCRSAGGRGLAPARGASNPADGCRGAAKGGDPTIFYRQAFARSIRQQTISAFSL